MQQVWKIHKSSKFFNRIYSLKNFGYLIVDGGGKLDAVHLVHVGLEVDEAHLGLLEVGGILRGLLSLLKFFVKVWKFLQVLKLRNIYLNNIIIIPKMT